MIKRIFNLSLSLCVGTWDFISGAIGRLLGHRAPSRCTVLAYHSVTPTQRSRFAHQMDILRSSVKPVGADIEHLPEQGGKYAAVTFDNRLERVGQQSLTELEEMGKPDK